MAGHPTSHLPAAMHYIRSAIELDNTGRVNEAYHSYLNSMLFIINTLRDDFSKKDFSLICKEDTMKLLTLIQHCQERATYIISSTHKKASPTSSNVSQANASLTLDKGDMARFNQISDTINKGKDATDSANLNKLIKSLPTPPVKKSPNLAPRRANSVNSVDKIKSRQMFHAYQRRLSIQRREQDKSFTSFRKTVEDMMLEKARRKASKLDQKLAERREKLRLKAEERYSDRTGSRVTDAAHEKEVYAKILEFEQETAWPQKLREHLAREPENIILIEEIVRTVLSAREHPLGQQMAEMQYALYRDLSIIVGNFSCPVFGFEDDYRHGAFCNRGNADEVLQADRTHPLEDNEAECHDEGAVVEENQEDLASNELASLSKTSTDKSKNTTSEDLQNWPVEQFQQERTAPGKKEEGSEEFKEPIDDIERFVVPVESEQFDMEFHDFEESMIEDLDSEDFQLLPMQENGSAGSQVLEKAAGEIDNAIVNSEELESQSEIDSKNMSTKVENVQESDREQDRKGFIVTESIVDQSGTCADSEELNSALDIGVVTSIDDGDVGSIGEMNEEEYRDNKINIVESTRLFDSDIVGGESGVRGESEDEQNDELMTREKSTSEGIMEEEEMSEAMDFRHIGENSDEKSNQENGSAFEKKHDIREDLRNKESSIKGENVEIDDEEHSQTENSGTYGCPGDRSCHDTRLPANIDEMTGVERNESVDNEKDDSVVQGSCIDESNRTNIGDDECPTVETEIVDEIFSDDSSEGNEVQEPTDIQKGNGAHSEKEGLLSDDINDSTVDVCTIASSKNKSCLGADMNLDRSYSNDGDNQLGHSSTSTAKYISKGEDEFSSYRNIPESVELRNDVEKVVKDIHSSLAKLHSLFIVTYDELDLPVGRDQSYAVIESMFFKPLWQWVNLAFRRLNVKKEITLYDVVKKWWHCNPAEFCVREKYVLLEDKDIASNYPYKSAVEELRKITSYSSPLDKLECIVLTTKLICQCVTDYWMKKGDSEPPSVGCDDLLPILSYVIVRASLPELVSECHAMEEFIQESYLLGEEGYCLTTLGTALAYALSLGNSDKPQKAV